MGGERPDISERGLHYEAASSPSGPKAQGKGGQGERADLQGPLSVSIVAIQLLSHCDPLSVLWRLLRCSAIDRCGCLSVRLMDLTGRVHG